MPDAQGVLARACALTLLVCAAAACAPAPGSDPLRPAVEHPSQGGSLRLVSEAPRSLDPAEADSIYESLPLNQIFNGLVAIGASTNVVPELASTWTISRDGRVYTLRLRSGVKFHDGSPLTASDVVFTFRRLLEPKRRGRNIACSYLQVLEGAHDYSEGRSAELSGVEALDPLTVRLRLTRPYYSFLQVLAMDGLKIVPRAVVEREGSARFGRAPVGTGAFRLTSFDSTGLRLEAYPDYFAGRAFLERVEIAFYDADEADSGAARFEARHVDVVEVQAEALARFRSNPDVLIHRYQGPSLSFLGLSTATGPLRDVRIRRAIASAIDDRGLVREAPAMRRGATGILPPGFQGYSPQPKTLPHNPGEARRLLIEAGHPEGRGLPVIDLFCSSSNAATIRTAHLIESDLDAVGIRIRVRPVAWGDLSERIDRQVAPLFLLSWVADLSDPDSFLRTLFESDGASNFFDFHDAETGALLDEGARETNPAKRTEIYRRCESRTLQLAPLVPLYYPISYLAARRRVRGLEVGPLGISNVRLDRVWLARAGGAPA